MKKNISITLLLVPLIIGLVRCSDENSDFKGADNYIYSFSLQIDGNNFSGLITDDKISITVPSNIELSDAMVKYELSEQASISPDPATITDWTCEQIIKVTSYNNITKDYIINVIRSTLEYEGNVTLATQTDVNNFAKKGVSYIKGHLTIGSRTYSDENDPIINLDGLETITSVKNNIIINNSFDGTNLNGLRNLTSAGNIYIGTISSSLTSSYWLDITLANLKEVGEIVINSAKTENISFPKLESAFGIYINSLSVSQLNFSSLKEVSGDLTIQSGTNANTSTANNVLTEISLDKIESIAGSLTFQGVIKVNKITLPVLQNIGNNFFLGYMDLLSSINIPELKQVKGKLTYSNLNAYTTLNAEKLRSLGSFMLTGNYSARPTTTFNLPLLEQVNGDFEIDYAAPQTLSFSSLKKIGGLFKLNYVETLENIELQSLTSCPQIYMSYVKLLPSLDISGVSDLEKIEIISGYILTNIKMPKEIGSITLNGGSLSTVFPILEGLENVKGTFTLSNYKLSDIAIPNVKHIGTYTQSSGTNQLTLLFADLENITTLNLSITSLTTLSAPKLTTIATLNLNSMFKLTSIDFSALTEVTEKLKIWGASYSGAASNCLMTNMDYFSNVSKIGRVDIKWCGKLTDFSGLKNAVSSLSSDKWSVLECKYNPTYQNMVDGKYNE